VTYKVKAAYCAKTAAKPIKLLFVTVTGVRYAGTLAPPGKYGERLCMAAMSGSNTRGDDAACSQFTLENSVNLFIAKSYAKYLDGTNILIVAS